MIHLFIYPSQLCQNKQQILSKYIKILIALGQGNPTLIFDRFFIIIKVISHLLLS